MEEWRDCVECPLYKVSSLGNVKSREHILKPWIQNNGYKIVSFCVNYMKKNYTVHSLVASAFLGQRPDKMVIDHKDGDKLNNSVENLQYITQSQNVRKGIGKGTNTGLKHISLSESNTYHLQIHRPDVNLSKRFKTLPEAVAFRDAYLLSEKMSD